MGYAQEYHVERYLREIFVPRIAPVSRVLYFVTSRLAAYINYAIGNDYELYWGKGFRPTT